MPATENANWRPDDVWVAILAQLSIYVNAHAEELRHLFVAHDGQKALSIEVGSLAGLDHGKMAYEMTKLMSGSSEMRNWICLAGALGPLAMEWVSYVPGYRTPALSGTGLCFASFR